MVFGLSSRFYNRGPPVENGQKLCSPPIKDFALDTRSRSTNPSDHDGRRKVNKTVDLAQGCGCLSLPVA